MKIDLFQNCSVDAHGNTQILKVGLSCSKKYHHLFLCCLKMKINEFQNCKFCFLEKQADLKTNCTRL